MSCCGWPGSAIIGPQTNVAKIVCISRQLAFAPELAYISGMGRKPAPKPDDPAQSKRFIDTATEVEADDEKALDRAFKKISSKNERTKTVGQE
jgi:hypothetical protein